MFEVTTLGQPLEVLKTQMAANRSQTMGQAFQTVWSRGGIKGFYQGLIPWVSLLFYLSLPCWRCVPCGLFAKSFKRVYSNTVVCVQATDRATEHQYGQFTMV